MGSVIKKFQKEMAYIFMQFLREEGQLTVLRRLEENSQIYFNLEFFGRLVAEGEWDDAEKYISAFLTMEDNEISIQIFFVLRKHKCLEALYRGERRKALGMLDNELNVFETPKLQKILSELRKVQKKKNFRNQKLFSGFEDMKSIRASVLLEITKLIKDNPKLRKKLEFPDMEEARLCKVIYQGLCWQHSQCKNPSATPNIKTLFIDHTCDPIEAPSQVPYPTSGVIPNADGFPQIDAANIIPMQSPLVPLATEHPIITAPISPRDNDIPISGRVLKRRLQEEFDSSQHEANAQQNVALMDELPLTLMSSLSPDSTVTTMDFHPVHQSLLLMGTGTGDISIWDVSNGTMLVHITYKNCRANRNLQKATTSLSRPAVNAVKWSSDGANFGVAYSRNILCLYNYFGGTEVHCYHQIVAHAGSVNDVAFTNTLDRKNLWVITCSDDMTVKVWDTFTAKMKFCFRGHEAAVLSVCHRKLDNLEALVSAGADGVIKIWCYDATASTINGKRTLLTAPDEAAPKIAFSPDGKRLFLGGTTRARVSCIVEIDQADGSIIHEYHGLVAPSVGVLHYDIANGRYLAAVDEHLLKFWDVNNEKVLKTTMAGGRLPASSRIKFNKEGTLLALTTKSNGIRILASTAGRRLLGAMGKRPVTSTSAAEIPGTSARKAMLETIEPCWTASRTHMMMDDIGGFNMPDENDGTAEELSALLETCTFKEINEVSECQCRRLPNKFSKKSVCWLAYTKAGRALLALGSNGEHRLWQWQKDAQNLDGMATTRFAPKIWQAPDDELMVNDVGSTNPEGHVSCFALPRTSRSFVVSTSGGMISIYNTMSFKTIAKFMTPPPAATSLAIHPMDNNKFVLGMDDGSIQIYDYRTRQVLSTLRGHNKRVTGLTFSGILNILVSSGADSQVCMWSIDKWEMLGSIVVQDAPRKASDTHVEFHKDHRHFLVVDKMHVAVYIVPELIPLNRWISEDASCSLITHAVYSCDYLSIFVGFIDGSVGVITTSNLVLRCKVNPTAYLPRNVKSKPYPLMVAAHPSEPNQFALGVSDGMVVVLEPLEEDAIWGNIHGGGGGGDDDDDDDDDVIGDDDIIDVDEDVEEDAPDLDQLQWKDSD